MKDRKQKKLSLKTKMTIRESLKRTKRVLKELNRTGIDNYFIDSVDVRVYGPRKINKEK